MLKLKNVLLKAGSSSRSRVLFCTLFSSFDCFIFRPLHFDGVVQRLLIRTGKGCGVLGANAFNLRVIAPCLHLPASAEGQSTGHDGSCRVGVEAVDHRQPFHQVSHM